MSGVRATAPAVRRLLGLPRRAVRWGRRTSDRLLHPWRRWAARRRVQQLGAIHTILFVCQGNICRSPYAAHAFTAALRRAGRNGTAAHSAGFLAPDRPSPGEARAVARRRGVILEDHRSQRLERGSLDGVDLVAVMNGSQARRLERDHGVPASRIVILGDLDTLPISSREVPDPVEQREAVFEAAYDRIDRCLEVLIGCIDATPSP